MTRARLEELTTKLGQRVSQLMPIQTLTFIPEPHMHTHPRGQDLHPKMNLNRLWEVDSTQLDSLSALPHLTISHQLMQPVTAYQTRSSSKRLREKSCEMYMEGLKTQMVTQYIVAHRSQHTHTRMNLSTLEIMLQRASLFWSNDSRKSLKTVVEEDWLGYEDSSRFLMLTTTVH